MYYDILSAIHPLQFYSLTLSQLVREFVLFSTSVKNQKVLGAAKFSESALLDYPK